jgi:hypothetical protein
MKNLWIYFCVVSLQGFAQILPESRSVNWTQAGLTDTSTSEFTLYNVLEEGAVADGATSVNLIVDSLLQLNDSNGIHLHFPQGNYLFTETVNLPENCLISGEGVSKTHFIFNLGGTGHAIQAIGNVIPSDSSSLLLPAAKGSNKIVITNAGIFLPGQWIRIQQQDADWVTSSWALNTVGQLAKIDSIRADTLFLASELRLDYPLNRLPKAVRINMKRNIGLQCFSMERIDNTAPEQASGIHFNYAENCWISGIESNKTTFAHIELASVTNSKIEQCYLHDAFEYGGGGRGYGVVMHFTTNECLIENSVFKRLRHSILLQAGANGNVCAFNYSTDPYWINANPLISGNSAGELVLHGNYVYANLFENNVVQNIVIDNSHGANGPYNTFLRNRAELYGIFFSDNTSPSQNFIANEITNNAIPYSLVNYNILGNDQFTYGNNNKGTISPAGTENVSDISYYYSSRPTFVQEYQWGKIGPPNAINTSSIPAQDRFNNQAIFAGSCGQEDFYAATAMHEIKEIRLYPNPVREQITLEGAGKLQNYRILDLWGREFQQGTINGDAMMIPVESLAPGLYLLITEEHTFRFVKW